MKSNISVVIPIYKPDKELICVLNRLMKQSVQPEEIILINTKTKLEDTYCVPEELSLNYKDVFKVVDISQDEFDHGATRHMGMQMAKCDYVLMMTQDAVPKNKYLLENLKKYFDGEGELTCDTAVAYARQLPRKNCRYIEKYIRSFNYPEKTQIKKYEDIETMGIKAFFCSDVCAMYDKKKYLEIGGFPNRTIFNEDAILAYKALVCEYEVAYVAEAEVIHSHNYSLVKEFQRNFDNGVSHKQFSYVFESVSTENEGIKLVKETAKHLYVNGKMILIPSLILRSGIKFVGFQLGKLYNRLPKQLVMKCTMNKSYWKRGI